MEESREIKKDYTISMIRMLAMIMIVCLHMDDSGFFGHNTYLDYILDAGVGLFFCISAWLYGKKKVTNDIKRFYTKSFLKILGQAWLFQGIILAVNILVFHKDFEGLEVVVNAIFGLCSYGYIDGCRHLWFITYILFCYLITPLLEWIDLSNSENSQKQFLIKLCIFIGVVLLLGRYKIIGLSVFYPIEYILVYFISRRVNYYEKTDTKALQYVVILGGMIFTGIWFLYMWYGFSGLPMSSTVKILQSQFETLTSAALFFVGYNLLNKFSPACSNQICRRVLAFFDRYSYSIYLTHAYFIWNTKLNFMFWSDYVFVNLFLTFFEVLLIGVFFQKIYEAVEAIIKNISKTINGVILHEKNKG